MLSLLQGVVKIGPWGGEGGLHWDIPAMATPLRLDSITVCSSLAVVDAISFRYWDAQGVKHDAGPWGGNDGDPYVVSADRSMISTCYLQSSLTNFNLEADNLFVWVHHRLLLSLPSF